MQIVREIGINLTNEQQPQLIKLNQYKDFVKFCPINLE